MARPAATVLLLRDGPDGVGLQVFLQRRVAGMSFAGGATVFPGGGVHESDRPRPEHWAGPDPDAWAARLGVPADAASAFVLAAVRETFEECGVLLAERADGAPVPAAVLAAGRDDLVAHRRSFADLLGDTGLVVRSDLLHAWARWITPVTQPRRYDTVFFTALVPAGQRADDHTTEAVEARWWTPAAALSGHESGEIALMRPTLAHLRTLSGLDDAAAVHAAAQDRDITAILPMEISGGNGIDVLLPGDAGYDPVIASGGVR